MDDRAIKLLHVIAASTGIPVKRLLPPGTEIVKQRQTNK